MMKPSISATASRGGRSTGIPRLICVKPPKIIPKDLDSDSAPLSEDSSPIPTGPSPDPEFSAGDSTEKSDVTLTSLPSSLTMAGSLEVSPASGITEMLGSGEFEGDVAVEKKERGEKEELGSLEVSPASWLAGVLGSAKIWKKKKKKKGSKERKYDRDFLIYRSKVRIAEILSILLLLVAVTNLLLLASTILIDGPEPPCYPGLLPT